MISRKEAHQEVLGVALRTYNGEKVIIKTRDNEVKVNKLILAVYSPLVRVLLTELKRYNFKLYSSSFFIICYNLDLIQTLFFSTFPIGKILRFSSSFSFSLEDTRKYVIREKLMKSVPWLEACWSRWTWRKWSLWLRRRGQQVWLPFHLKPPRLRMIARRKRIT